MHCLHSCTAALQGQDSSPPVQQPGRLLWKLPARGCSPFSHLGWATRGL